MPKWFNTAGPCKPDMHYMLAPLARLPNLERLVAQQGYFVIHAPRQTGKTTAMLTLAQQLTESGQYTAIMVSAEVGAAFPGDIAGAERAMLQSWRNQAENRLPPALQPPPWPVTAPGQGIQAALQSWARDSSNPLVVLIDEIDVLRDDVLISFLRQLRSGYPDRPRGFPQSLALIGVRDVRDVTLGMELKVWREGRPDPIQVGLEQLDRYLAGLGLENGWLVIFDQRPGLLPIAERTTTEQAQTTSGRQVTVIRG